MSRESRWNRMSSCNEKNGIIRHYLTTCKKTPFSGFKSVQKRETAVALTQIGTKNQNYLFFSSFLTIFSNFLHQKSDFMTSNSTTISRFYSYLIIFLVSAETTDSFRPVSLKLSMVSKNCPSFTETRSLFWHFFLCLFGIKLAKRPVSWNHLWFQIFLPKKIVKPAKVSK